MDAPSGVKDLISDAEEHIRQQEEQLAKAKQDLAAKKSLAGVVVEDADGQPRVTTAELANVDDSPRELDWNHDQVEYGGELFNVKRPQPQALTAFAIASGKYVPEETQRNLVSLFVRNHMSPKSFLRFFERMMDPDDPDFDAAALGEMMRLISTRGTARPTKPSRV